MTMSLEAIAAVNRTAFGGLEGHLRGATALIANDFIHLTGATGGATIGAASGAASGLVLETFLGEESLLISGEDELLTTLFAYKGLVLIHWGIPPDNDTQSMESSVSPSPRHLEKDGRRTSFVGLLYYNTQNTFVQYAIAKFPKFIFTHNFIFKDPRLPRRFKAFKRHRGRPVPG
jgi:hypothetical protein